MTYRKPWHLLLLTLSSAQYASAQHHHGVNDTLPPFNATGDEPMSYALFPANKGYFYAHVTLMVIAFWILMPMGIMFGIARSSMHVPIQILAFCVAFLGFFFARLYGHSVPHLYSGNAHHSMGWIMFLLMVLQLTVGIVRKVANAIARNQGESNQLERVHLVERTPSSPSSSNGARHIHTDSHSEGSVDTLHHNNQEDEPFMYKDDESQLNHLEDEDDEVKSAAFSSQKLSLLMRAFNAVSPYIPAIVRNMFVIMAYNPFTKTACRYFHLILGRSFVLLAFVQTQSGLVVYHGVCRSWAVLGCIAHLIKGGIFFFYGIITFGRYLGAFSDRGWGWNRVDGASKFSFEMIESCLIFTYGITNTWMEHFGQDSQWTHKDLEHASLAFMWWWCGLLGILVESRALRRLLERAIMSTPLEVPRHETRQSYSLNPFPALTVLMTGISMGNHHQDSTYSTNVHYMWGMLLSLASACRFITYVSLYRNPPTDRQPSRPPSELLGSFLMISGSILFMASNSGTLTWLMRNEIDSMFLMNVCVALTAITLTYVAGLLILKAWSMKREQRKIETRRRVRYEERRTVF